MEPRLAKPFRLMDRKTFRSNSRWWSMEKRVCDQDLMAY